jgi:glycosyltransferase involved in cell wall biosynthesis
MRKVIHKPKLRYSDNAYWNVDFIKALGNFPEFECHVISYHLGLKKKQQRFINDRINYIFLQEKENLLRKILKILTRSKIKDNYLAPAHKIKNVVNEIDPDIVIVCGAENPIYSGSALLINDKPIFVILQTLLNDTMRIQAGIGSETRRQLENKVFRHADYYASFNLNEACYIRNANPRSHCLRLMFPSSPTDVSTFSEKDYDFVFYANGLSKHKGTEDTLLAFSLVCEKHPQARMYVIGASEEDYKTHLKQLLQDKGIESNVTFHGPFPTKQDVISEVLRAKVAVLPGITAPLNSTVREAMFLGMPTVVYDNSVIQLINKEKACLVAAKMEDVADLGKKMIYTYEHPNEMSQIGLNAKDYAFKTFSQEAVGKTLRKEILAIVDHYYHQQPISKDLLLI